MRSTFGLSSVPEELSVFEALACGPFAPSSETAWLKGFSHVNDDLAFVQTGNFSNFLKGDAVGPGGPNDPIGAVLGWLGLFDPGDGKFRLFRTHDWTSLKACFNGANPELRIVREYRIPMTRMTSPWVAQGTLSSHTAGIGNFPEQNERKQKS